MAADLTPAAVAATKGSPERDRLFVLLYDELHRMAQRELRRNRGTALSPTTLLHETFLDMSQRAAVAFADHGKLMSYAARAMRSLIIDYVRSGRAQKRGGAFDITSLPDELPHTRDDGDLQIDKLNEALETLAGIDARLAECVDLKFFCGFSFTEIARMRNVSERTVKRDWRRARLLLSRLVSHRHPSLASCSSVDAP